MSYDKSQEVINNQPGYPVVNVEQAPEFGKEPVFTECPNCKESIQTVVTLQTGQHAWLWSGLICMNSWVCYCAPILCAPIPLCMKRLKDAIHTCPKCGKVVGKSEGKFKYLCCTTYNKD